MEKLSFFKKIILVSLSFLLLVTSNLSLAPSVLAQDSTWYNQPFTEWYSKVYGEETPPSEIFGERYTAAQVQWILWSLISQPLNWLGKENQEFITCTLKYMGGEGYDLIVCTTAGLNWIRNVLNLISPFTIGYDHNTSTYEFLTQNSVGIKYINGQLSKLNLIQPVQAQEGFGYGKIGIMQPLWQISRNLAYSFLVFFTIIFAFMIMFRVKISPQVVISVQSALPKIIGAAVLATFSYAIAGLAIDLLYVVSGFLAGFLNPISWGGGFRVIYNFITGGGLFGIEVTSPLAILVYMLIYTTLFLILVVLNFAYALTGTLSVFSMLLSVLMLLLVVWLVILCVWFMIKIPWMLIKTLINIYISVAVAPIQIVLGSVMPSVGFGTWFKNLMANILVFPLVGVMFFLAYSFLGYGFVTLADTVMERSVVSEILQALGMKIEGFVTGNLWSPPFLGSGAEITPLIFALMSFGIIIAIPKSVDILKALLLGAKFDYGMAIGEAMGPAKAIWGATGGNIWQGIQRARGEEFYQEYSPTINKIIQKLTPKRFRRSSEVPEEKI